MAASGPRKGQFEKGNKHAKGGARPNAGRPLDVVKKATKELFEGRMDAALAVIDDLLDPASEAEPAVRLKASELVFAYARNKPTQPTQHSGDLAWMKVYGPNMPTEKLMQK